MARQGKEWMFEIYINYNFLLIIFKESSVKKVLGDNYRQETYSYFHFIFNSL